jgi:general secretion pathway protein G
MYANRNRKSAFTLVEILIVVIILGILAAIVIPQFTSASQDARKNSLVSQLQTIKAQLELARLQHLDKDDVTFAAGGSVPIDLSAPGPWVHLVVKTNADSDAAGYTTTTPPGGGQPPFGPYLQAPPRNPLNQFAGVAITNADVIYGQAFGGGAGMGWIYNPTNGKVWATSAKCGFVYNEGDASATTNDN